MARNLQGEYTNPNELIKSDAPVLVGVHFLHDIADLSLAHPAALSKCVSGQAIQQHLDLARVQGAVAIAVNLHQPHAFPCHSTIRLQNGSESSIILGELE